MKQKIKLNPTSEMPQMQKTFLLIADSGHCMFFCLDFIEEWHDLNLGEECKGWVYLEDLEFEVNNEKNRH